MKTLIENPESCKSMTDFEHHNPTQLFSKLNNDFELSSPPPEAPKACQDISILNNNFELPSPPPETRRNRKFSHQSPKPPGKPKRGISGLNIFDIPYLPILPGSTEDIENQKQLKISPPEPASMILDCLYVGGVNPPQSIIDKTHVVISVLEEQPCFTVQIPEKHHFVIHDVPDIAKSKMLTNLDKIVDIIDEAIGQNKNVYIHCGSGISRSPTITIAYMMKHQKNYFEKAKEYVCNKRPQININAGFYSCLMVYDAWLRTMRETSFEEYFSNKSRKYVPNT